MNSYSKKRKIFLNKMFVGGICFCAWCAQELSMDTATIDHNVPKLHGGRDYANNFLLSCRACNSIRGRDSFLQNKINRKNMIKEVNELSFDEEINKKGYVLVDFFADWCVPCKKLTPILEKISLTKDVVKLNTDSNPNIAKKFGIKSIPTLILFKDGQVVDRVVGLVSADTILNMYK